MCIWWTKSFWNTLNSLKSQKLSNFHWKHNCVVGTQWNSLALVGMNWFSENIEIQMENIKKQKLDWKKLLPSFFLFIHPNVSVLQTTAPGKESCPIAMQPPELYFFAFLSPQTVFLCLSRKFAEIFQKWPSCVDIHPQSMLFSVVKI